MLDGPIRLLPSCVALDKPASLSLISLFCKMGTIIVIALVGLLSGVSDPVTAARYSPWHLETTQ